MKRLSLIFAVAAVVAVWPASSGAATFTGVVVAKQHGALLVASPAGVVTAVTGRASIGSRVTVSGGSVTVVGRAHVARVRGIVVRRVGATMFLSSNRHLVAVHTGRVLASVNDTTPPPTTPAPTTPATGDNVSAQVTIGNGGELDESSVENLGSSNASSLQVQAVVASVGPGTVTLTVGTQTLTVPLPAGLTLPASMVGQTVTLSLELNGQSGQNGDDSNDNNDSNDDGDNGGGGSGGSGGSSGSSGSGSFGGGGNGG
ncbi:MAG TPA: hypothetical protein VNY33_04000 [Gaiellaceae bacterium]|jgi:hypothetical protein|nr:hypothetical protein [Gaiellaceae bacterium]